MIIAITVVVAGGVSMSAEQTAVVAQGKTVFLDYTLTVEGKVIDSSQGKQPLEFVQGSGRIIKGLERQIEGMNKGEKKTIVVTPEEGYGPVDPAAFTEVEKAQLPQTITPAVGQVLQANAQDGRQFPVTISEVKDTTVMVNFNHPLAGKTLQFDVTVVDVK